MIVYQINPANQGEWNVVFNY